MIGSPLEVVGRAPLKPQLSAPVASSSSNSTSPPPSISSAGDAGSTVSTTSNACENVATDQTHQEPQLTELNKTRSVCQKGVERNSASELAPEVSTKINMTDMCFFCECYITQHEIVVDLWFELVCCVLSNVYNILGEGGIPMYNVFVVLTLLGIC